MSEPTNNATAPVGVNLYITTCTHGVDLRFTPRCYLCKPVSIEAEARADLAARIVAAVEAVVTQAEPDDDFDGQFIDYLVPHDAMEGLRAVLDAIREASDE